MTAPVVERDDLLVGRLLAEGGEGRVFELQDQPGLLYKGYRRPAPVGPLAALVAWPGTVMVRAPELARRVGASAAWPASVVVSDAAGGLAANGGAGRGPAGGGVIERTAAGDGLGGNGLGVNGLGGGLAAGLLLPRAPRRFSLRHRDGSVHLATLSYLTAAPGQRSAAYGLALPAPMSPERLGIVYALARLLEALQSASPSVGHGDLSTKNVLWSLERGPEVFLLDCDSAERYGPGGALVDDDGRRRAMTPNWDDPAIPPGSNPTLESDRYSLALIFLRVAGAAHFPIQARQRTGESLRIDFEVPAGASRARSLDASAPLWDLCERSLSVTEPASRPLAAAWAAALEQVLDDLGAMGTVRAVWAAQGGGTPGPTPPAPATGPGRQGRDVVVTPVAVAVRAQHWQRVAGSPPPAPGRPGVPGRTGLPGKAAAPPVPNPLRPGGLGRPTLSQAVLAAASVTPVPVLAPARAGLRRAVALWLDLHRRMLRTLATRGRLALGLVRLAGCVVVDLMVVAVVAFVLAMIISPVLRI
jgi:hypothetical protein